MCDALTNPGARKYRVLLLLALLVPLFSIAQTPPAAIPPHRTRLILKDGSFQVVMSYRIVGPNVLYISAERGGAEEVVPGRLVDFDATQLWEQRHPAFDPDNPQATAPPPPIDPELLKEEADRAAYTPQIAPDLSLPEQDSVLALDTFQGTPELIPLPQSSGELNHNTAHNLLRSAINPLAAPHQVVQLRGERSPVQLHVSDPVFYLRIGEASPYSTGGGTLTVDTHGASAAAPTASDAGSPSSRYVIVRTDVRTDARVITSFNLAQLGSGHPPEDVVETTPVTLPGGHWLKLTPQQPLLFGEYALLEVLSDRNINLDVWDFGIHPVAPENRDAILPRPKRPFSLDHRRPTD